MAIYKFVDIENQTLIADRLYDFVVNRTDILQAKRDWTPVSTSVLQNYIPELFNELKKFVDQPVDVSAFVFRRVGYEETHIDDGKDIRFLFPVRNCQRSYTKFYDLNGNIITRVVEGKGNVWWRIGKDFPLKEIDRLELLKPVFFDPGIPHGVYTPPDLPGPRLSFTCSFKGISPEHLIR
jgi:hypothetical protein